MDSGVEPKRSRKDETPADFWRAPIRFLFGYDIFISYARADADAYAELLETKLEAAGFAAFRDKREISAGEQLDNTLQRAIRRSRHFVLLDSPAARQSPWVAGEIRSFLRSKSKRLIRIRLANRDTHPDGAAVTDPELSRKVEGFVWTSDTPEAFQSGKPSDAIVEQITRGFRSIKLRNLMRLTAGLIIAVLLTLLTWSVNATRSARRQAKIATSRELVAASMANLSLDPERSILLALHAVAVARGVGEEVLPQAQEELHQAILRSRIRKNLFDRSGPVSSVVWSPNGDRLAVAYPKAIKIWNTANAQILRTLTNSASSPFQALAWSPDGEKLASTLFDSTLEIWDARDGRTIGSCKGAGSHIAWRPDGKVLAAGHTALSLWDPETCSLLRRLGGNGDEIMSISWSPDGRRLVTGTWCDTCAGAEHHSAQVWDIGAGKLVSLTGHADSVQAVAWSPDGKRIATGSDDLTAKIWDADTGQDRITLSGFGGPVLSVAWSLDAHLVAAAGEDRTIKIWNAATGEQMDSLVGHQDTVSGVAWNPAGDLIASGSKDGAVKLWQSGPNPEWPLLLPDEPYRAIIWSIAWSPDGKQMLTGGQDAVTRVWEVGKAKQLLKIKGHSPRPFDADIAGVMTVAWSPNGQRIATGGADGVAKIWNASTGEQLLTISGSPKSENTAVLGISWSPDSKLLATGVINDDAIIWDAQTGVERLRLSTASSSPLPNGKRFEIPSAGLRCLAWSRNGKVLVGGGDMGQIWFWDAQSGRTILTLQGKTSEELVQTLAWSEDDRQIAVGQRDGVVKILNGDSGNELRKLGSHRGGVTDVAWSPDGRQLATAGVDGTTKIWRPETGVLLMTITNTGPATSVAWSADGKKLAVAGTGGYVELYSLDLGDLVDLARRRITRNLTPAECKQYLHVDSCPNIP